MNTELAIMFFCALIGFSVIAYVIHKFVDWLFGDHDKEKQ